MPGLEHVRPTTGRDCGVAAPKPWHSTTPPVRTVSPPMPPRSLLVVISSFGLMVGHWTTHRPGRRQTGPLTRPALPRNQPCSHESMQATQSEYPACLASLSTEVQDPAPTSLYASVAPRASLRAASSPRGGHAYSCKSLVSTLAFGPCHRDPPPAGRWPHVPRIPMAQSSRQSGDTPGCS